MAKRKKKFNFFSNSRLTESNWWFWARERDRHTAIIYEYLMNMMTWTKKTHKWTIRYHIWFIGFLFRLIQQSGGFFFLFVVVVMVAAWGFLFFYFHSTKWLFCYGKIKIISFSFFLFFLSHTFWLSYTWLLVIVYRGWSVHLIIHI